MELQNEVNEWQKETFGNAQTVGGILNHLAKELSELYASPSLENEIEECADMVILLMGYAGIKHFDLLKEVKVKLEVNKRRTWNKPDYDGVISHVKP